MLRQTCNSTRWLPRLLTIASRYRSWLHPEGLSDSDHCGRCSPRSTSSKWRGGCPRDMANHTTCGGTSLGVLLLAPGLICVVCRRAASSAGSTRHLPFAVRPGEVIRHRGWSVTLVLTAAHTCVSQGRVGLADYDHGLPGVEEYYNRAVRSLVPVLAAEPLVTDVARAQDPAV